MLTHIEHFQHNTDEQKIEGVIFTSSDNKIFLAGADLYEMSKMLDSSILIGGVIDAGPGGISSLVSFYIKILLVSK